MANSTQGIKCDDREFEKGDIFEVDFPGGRGQYVIEGKHMAVALYSYEFPRRTVIVAPITSLHNGSGVRKVTIETDVILPDTESYLSKESYVKMEQLTCVDRSALGDYKGRMSELFLAEASLNMIELLELEDAVEALVRDRLDKKRNEEVS